VENLYNETDTGKFKKGNPGGGRPAGSGLKLTPLLKKALEGVPEGQKETYAELFIKSLMHKALVDKDATSIKIIMNYVDGLPKAEIDMNHFLPTPIDDVFKDYSDEEDIPPK